ncbi:hypothetical protein BGZ80_001093, partial [Entomortierella chlamydospora]
KFSVMAPFSNDDIEGIATSFKEMVVVVDAVEEVEEGGVVEDEYRDADQDSMV